MVRRRAAAGLIWAALTIGCGGSGPTSPSPNPTPNPTPTPGPQPTPGPHLVSGAIVSAIDDSGVNGVSFTVNSTLVGRSDANGMFTVGFFTSGLNRTTLSAAGFVDRQTNILAPGGSPRLSMIPASFDVAAFDQMFRHASVGGQPNGLTRWTSPPGIVLERRVVDFTDVCAQSYQTLDETISDAHSQEILTDMRDGYDMLTASRIGPLASATTQTTGAGTALNPRQPGRIVVMRGVGLQQKTTYWGYACWSTTGDGEVTGGFIVLDRNFDTNPSSFHRSLRMHELGHTLGCQHVTTGRVSVMNTNAQTVPNDFDRAAARIATLRPTGNRTPDIDPVSFTATTARRVTEPLTWHGAH